MEISLNNNPQTSIQPNATDTIPGETNIGETQEPNSIDSILDQALEVVANVVGENGAEIVRTVINVIELDDPDSEAMDQDLETLIGMLQLEEGEIDAAAAKERIKQLSSQFKAIHDKRQAKIDEAVKKQEKADKAAKRNKWLSIFGAVFAVVAAVVTSVLTLGASTVIAAGVVAAAFSIASATLAVVGCALTLSGGDEKLMKLLADVHQKCSGCSDKRAKEFASDFYAYFGLALSLTCAIGGLTSGIVNSVKLAAEKVTYLVSAVLQKVINHSMQGIGLVNSAVTTGLGADSMHKNTEATKANAKTKEIAAIIQLIQKQMDDSQEMLEKIVEQIQNIVASMLAVLDEVADTKANILETMPMV